MGPASENLHTWRTCLDVCNLAAFDGKAANRLPNILVFSALHGAPINCGQFRVLALIAGASLRYSVI
jgi:hypothetical protein